MNVKTHFSIKDLEQLSGVKAHTIRIWEKRYNLLTPSRSETNIRSYSSAGLQKLLNVTSLYNDGYKISKIAKLTEDKVAELVREREISNNHTYAIDNLKMAMLAFDLELFDKTFDKLLEDHTFSEVYERVIVPFLLEIGTLWQTGTIDPTHERFISELVKVKIVYHSELIRKSRSTSETTKFALFLPYNEVHEIGLLFANYELLKQGYNTVYLGNNIPLKSLRHVQRQHHDAVFISYITMDPEGMHIDEYIATFDKEIVQNNGNALWLIGQKTSQIDQKNLPSSVKTLSTLDELNELITLHKTRQNN